VLRREPALAPDIVRAFRVADASLDSFDLLHRLAARVRAAGGQVWLRHEFRALLQSSGRIVGAEAQDLRTGEERRVEAEMVVNAAGPWAGSVASGAGISLPLSLSKGTMVALAARPVQTVVNRCAYPGDGDILVPVGTVVVLGTTDTPVDSAEDLVPVVAEVHELLEAAAHLLPGVEAHRPLRAWSGVRTLYRPPGSSPDETRALPRSHHIVDHAATDGIHGLLTIVGGKLTTYRRMAQDIVDQVASRLGNTRACATDDAVLDDDFGRFFALPSRWEAAESSDLRNDQPGMLCECELVTRASAEHALDEEPPVELDDLRRDLRLGMGPCQAAFCAYRAGDLLARRLPTEAWEAIGIFLQERWRGARILSWGHMLRQLELHQRISLELLETPPPMDSA
jgi:glycerol-3-phosphate dehydrogenase